MSNTKFTPGPWQILKRAKPMSIKCDIHQVTDKDRYPSAFVPAWTGGSNPAPEEALANAHLIAAAPELFEALVMWRDRIKSPDGPDMQTLLHMTDQAISKARGEQ